MEFALIPILLAYPVSACLGGPGGAGCCQPQARAACNPYQCGGGGTTALTPAPRPGDSYKSVPVSGFGGGGYAAAPTVTQQAYSALQQFGSPTSHDKVSPNLPQQFGSPTSYDKVSPSLPQQLGSPTSYDKVSPSLPQQLGSPTSYDKVSSSLPQQFGSPTSYDKVPPSSPQPFGSPTSYDKVPPSSPQPFGSQTSYDKVPSSLPQGQFSSPPSDDRVPLSSPQQQFSSPSDDRVPLSSPQQQFPSPTSYDRVPSSSPQQQFSPPRYDRAPASSLSPHDARVQYRDSSLSGAQSSFLPSENPSVPGRFKETPENSVLTDGGAIDPSGISSSIIVDAINDRTQDAAQVTLAPAPGIPIIPKTKLRHLRY